LPPFLLEGGAAGWEDIEAGWRITGHFLARDLLMERQADLLDARARLTDRLRRAAA
jgi:DNA repair protein RecO (recombination protein O)